MAGVIQEIDLVLSQQSLQKLTGDLDKASQQIGQGLAKGATPAALEFSKNLVTTLQERLRTESGVLAKQLAEGSLSPAAYAAAAQRLGKSIVQDLNKGIATGGKLELFGGEAGVALRNQLGAVFTEVTGRAGKAGTAVAAVGTASTRAAPGIHAIRTALFSLATSAAGVPGPLGSIANGLLLFGGGAGVALAAAAAIGSVALAVNLLTKAAREGKKAADDLINSIQNIGKSRFEVLTGTIATVEKQIADTEKRIRDLRDIRAASGFRAGGPGSQFGIGIVISDKELDAELKRLDQLRGGLQRLKREREGAVPTERESLIALAGGQEAIEARQEAARHAEEAQRRAVQLADKLEQHLKDLQQQEDETRGAFSAFWDEIEAKANLAGPAVVARITEMREAAQKAFDQDVQRGFDHTVANLDLIEKELGQIGEKDPIFRKFKAQAEDTRTSTERLRDSIHEITGALDNLIQRNGIRLLGEDATRSIGAVLNLADAVGNLRDAAGGVTTGGVIGLVSAGVGFVTGLFHKNKNPGRFKANQQWFEAAMQGDPRALDELLRHSPVDKGGEGAWAKRDAQEDAWAKYQAAKAKQDADRAQAEAPGKAEEAARAAEQTERERLDRVREAEEESVAGRLEAERRAHIQQLVTGGTEAGGPAAELAKRLQELEKEFEEIARRSPLGAEGPAARDAQRRADEAARELENAIEDAKREAERQKEAAGEKITAVGTIQRTITEASAGAIVGNLVTIASYTSVLPEIRDYLRDGRPALPLQNGGSSATGPDGGVLPFTNDGGPLIRVEVPVNLDGREVARIVGEHQYREFQDQAGLAGNSLMS